MIKKILVPTDNSSLSEKTFVEALKFADMIKAEVTLMTVAEPYSNTKLSEYNPEDVEEYENRVTDDAQDKLDKLVEKHACDVETKPVTTIVRKGFIPAEEIVKEAKKGAYDLIFMASHGREGLSAVLLGSETQKVLSLSHVPVMVYR